MKYWELRRKGKEDGKQNWNIMSSRKKITEKIREVDEFLLRRHRELKCRYELKGMWLFSCKGEEKKSFRKKDSTIFSHALAVKTSI